MTGLRMNPRQDHLDSYSCTKEFWIELRDIGLKMVEAGASGDTTPLRAFGHQRQAAVMRRNIQWKLTLPEWWAIWQDSGKWEQRGVGRGYMMCRKGDKGAYEVGNVYIGSGEENLSAAAKKTNLPIGVAHSTKSRTNPFRAYCNVNGKQHHLGLFKTAEDAERAYLAARELDMALKELALLRTRAA